MQMKICSAKSLIRKSLGNGYSRSIWKKKLRVILVDAKKRQKAKIKPGLITVTSFAANICPNYYH